MLAITVGATFAQAPTASTALPQPTTSGPALVIDASSDSSAPRVNDHDGVITDKPPNHTSEIIVPATDDKVTTRKASEATTIR
jgi:hypothetical protein